MKTQYLINETPLMVLPSLMKAFNGNYTKALILQQIHFMCSWPNSGVEHDGERWVWFTYDEFAEQFMPWISGRNVRQNVRELEKDGLLLSTTRIRDSWDNTKFYRVDESAILRMVNGGTQDAGIDASNDVTSECHIEAAPECQSERTPECRVLYTHQSSKQSAESGPTPTQLGKRRQMQTPEHIKAAKSVGLTPADMTAIVNAVLTVTGKKAVADVDDSFGERELANAQECAAGLVKRGVKTPQDVVRIADAFRAEHPNWTPAYGQLIATATTTTPATNNAPSSRYTLQDVNGVMQMVEVAA